MCSTYINVWNIPVSFNHESSLLAKKYEQHTKKIKEEVNIQNTEHTSSTEQMVDGMAMA